MRIGIGIAVAIATFCTSCGHYFYKTKHCQSTHSPYENVHINKPSGDPKVEINIDSRTTAPEVKVEPPRIAPIPKDGIPKQETKTK